MPNRKNNLLIVEDDVQLRILLTAILTRSGYSVRVAEDGFAALIQIRAEMPDLILSDLYMLGMSGFELLSIVRRRYPEVTVIAMSSAFSGFDIPAGVAADAFYQKATGIAALISLLEECASLSELHLASRFRGSAPIWIATHPPRSGAAEPISITCPECMRTSAYAPGPHISVVRQADCAFCHTRIQYAMVQTTDPGPPQDLWRQPIRLVSTSTAAA